MEGYFEKPNNLTELAMTIITPTGLTLNQILQEIESIFKFKDLVPMPADK